MTPIKSIQRSFVSLKLPRRVSALVTYAQNVIAAMTNNPRFPTPVPALSAIAAAITALQSAEATTLRTKGTTVERNDKKEVLVALLQQLRGYVQATADADPENSAAIIQSAAFPLRKPPVHKPRVFTAKQGPVSGSAEIIAAAGGKRAAYEWQYSLDAGKTWIEAPPSLQARTTIVGLPVASSVQFRCRTVVKKGPGDWSAPVTLVVK